MGLKSEGYAFFEPGHELVELLIHNKEAGVETRESIYEPTETDIAAVCKRYDLDFTRTMKLIKNKDPNVHTLIIDVQKYRDHLWETRSG